MTHPTEALTDYLDGSLSPGARAEVDAHLAGCASCRHELEQAGAAKAALGRLPELEAPVGISQRVARDTTNRARSSTSSGGYRRTYQVVAGLVAAALVGVFAFSTLNQDGSRLTSMELGDDSEAAGAPEAAAPTQSADAAGGADRDGDYTGPELQFLADREVAFTKGPARDALSYEEAQNQNASSGAPQGDTTSSIPLNGENAAAFKEARNIAADPKVQRCLRKAGAYESGGTLQRAFEATLVGVPSYFGVFQTGEAPGDPVDRIVVWVAAKQGCEVVGFAQSYIVRPSPSPYPEELAGITPPPGL